jgi:hypothetical protein
MKDSDEGMNLIKMHCSVHVNVTMYLPVLGTRHGPLAGSIGVC